jgi:UrcA family protein
MNNRTLIKTLFPFAAAFAFSIGFSTANASEAVTAAASVTYGDLNLEDPAGAAKLYRRIQSAAERVCGPSGLINSALVNPAWRDCVADAVDEAVEAVDSAALSAYHAVKTTPRARAVERVARN